MPISNYTTKIDPDKTIGEIARMLSRFGARRVMTDYADGEAIAVHFVLPVKGTDILYQLPCNAEGVLKTLERDGVARQYRTLVHARRVAWRIIRDWVEAQIAIVDAGQALMAEVFLPYAVGQNGKTLFQSLEAGELKMLNQKNS